MGRKDGEREGNKRIYHSISLLEMEHGRGNRGMNGGQKVQINTLCQGSCGAQWCHCFVFVPVSSAELFLPLVEPVVYNPDSQICKSQHE